eukprot:CAMPEP_0116879302 /NCGR_PEP_ID=MMETSP0463-20121206/11103_1 /TAXON_ID=181622 /ORGANISM="Strombidinopsis sp, Strain SopsisLIS2011" /LENGTH=50 /DNA_ID=CAMNT_0004528489 /DNA_START=415 /DNA_END=567 /DNA_ORIENTATION=+
MKQVICFNENDEMIFKKVMDPAKLNDQYQQVIELQENENGKYKVPKDMTG